MSYLLRCTKEQAKALKEIGFNVPVSHTHFSDDYELRMQASESNYNSESWNKIVKEGVQMFSAPLVLEALKWIEEKHKIYVERIVDFTKGGTPVISCIVKVFNKQVYRYSDRHGVVGDFPAALDYILKYLKEQNPTITKNQK